MHFMGGVSAANAFGIPAEIYLLYDETAPEDDLVYYKAFEFVAFLDLGAPLSQAGWWVKTNLGK